MSNRVPSSSTSWKAARSAATADESSFTAEEKVQLLQNQIEFLEGEVEEKRWAVNLLLKDNAEIEFLAGLSPRERQGQDYLYLTNRYRIAELNRELDEAKRDLRRYKRALAAQRERVTA